MRDLLFLKVLLIAVALLGFEGKSLADEPFRLHRYDSFKVLPACNDGDIVFIGNSITNMMNWYEAFGSTQHIHGRGNSGGYTQEILDNIESMIAGNPSKVFLMIGTNDLGTNGDFYTPQLTADRIILIMTRILAETEATVYYQSILPSKVGIRTEAKTVTTNNLVKEWIDNEKNDRLVYIDLYSQLVTEDGELSKTKDSYSSDSYSWDGLHLTQKGYKVWMDIIKDYVGAECIYPADAANLWGNLAGSSGMRVTYFGASPVDEDDILLIGDEMIHNGEWHELLGSSDFKDRGIGWGYPSVTISQLTGAFDAIFNGNKEKGVKKNAPKGVVFYAGLSDVNAGTMATTIVSNYRKAIQNIREMLPETDVFVMTLLPFASNSATNVKKIIDVNAGIRNLAAESDKIHLIDLYEATYDDERIEEYFMGAGNIYLSGLGYARVAGEIGKVVNEVLGTNYEAMSLNEAQANIERYKLRKRFYDKLFLENDQDSPVQGEDVIISVDRENGELIENSASTWRNTWQSANGLLKFYASANNMQWNGNNIDARSGLATISSYILSTTSDYNISEFTITLRALTDDQIWTIADKTVTVTSGNPVTLNFKDINSQTVECSLSGANTGTLITNFNVTLTAAPSFVKVDMDNGNISGNQWISNDIKPQTAIYSSNGEIIGNGTTGIIIKLNGNSTDVIINVEDGYRIDGYTFDFDGNGKEVKVASGNNALSSGIRGNVFVSHNVDEGPTFTLNTSGGEVSLSNFYVLVSKTVEKDNSFVVFETTETGVPYRIPAIASTIRGNLVAVSDYRYSKGDIGVVKDGKLDLRYRIRDAKTGEWGEVKTLAKARNELSGNVAFGDPCIVADRESDRILVTSCSGNVSFPSGTHDNHQGWARFYSDNGGETWSDYEDISDQVFNQLDVRKDGEIRCFFIGSGKILQSGTVKVGDYYRLYCAALVKVGDGTNTNYVFYSDDFGMNWKLLGTPDYAPVPTGADEPKTEELPDGSILVSSRMSGGRYYNIYHFTDAAKGEGKWSVMATSNEDNGGVVASSNACNGETLCVPAIRNSDGEKVYLMLQSVPMHPNQRANVGINYKELADLNDFRDPAEIARNWDGSYQVSTTTSAYSTMTLDKDNNIAFFYEENSKNSGYDMVYKSITVDDITSGEYRIAPASTEFNADFMKKAMQLYQPAIDGKFGEIVGMYTGTASETIGAAVSAYLSQPTSRNYELFNIALETAETVEIIPGKQYYLVNYGNSDDDNIYIMTIQSNGHYFVAKEIASAPATEINQYFEFVPAEEEGLYYFYHPSSGKYFGKLGNNNSLIRNVDNKENAGIFEVESSSEGLSVLKDIDKTDFNCYVSLHSNNSRIVAGPAVESSMWFIIPADTSGINEISDGEKIMPVDIYDLSGRKVNNPAKGNVYIINGHKEIIH